MSNLQTDAVPATRDAGGEAAELRPAYRTLDAGECCWFVVPVYDQDGYPAVTIMEYSRNRVCIQAGDVPWLIEELRQVYERITGEPYPTAQEKPDDPGEVRYRETARDNHSSVIALACQDGVITRLPKGVIPCPID